MNKIDYPHAQLINSFNLFLSFSFFFLTIAYYHQKNILHGFNDTATKVNKIHARTHLHTHIEKENLLNSKNKTKIQMFAHYQQSKQIIFFVANW